MAATLNAAESEIKSVIFRNQVDCTRMIGTILKEQAETLCGNDLEVLAQYLTVLGAVKEKIESFQNTSS